MQQSIPVRCLRTAAIASTPGDIPILIPYFPWIPYPLLPGTWDQGPERNLGQESPYPFPLTDASENINDLSVQIYLLLYFSV